MEQFAWDAYFETGLPEVDFRHHGLVDLINRFGELLLRPQDVQADEVSQVLGELASYAHLHFTEEEQLMVRCGVDARHIDAHSVKHADFLREVRHQRSGLPELSSAATSRLHGFLVSWLAFHILGIDQDMAKQIAAIQAGNSPSVAFDSIVETQDPATAMLVQSMDRLFRQISDRNRELFELNQSLETRVEQRTQQLSEANRRLEGLALTDTLTGLANRRAAIRRLHAEWEAGESVDSPLSCIIIDADGFKFVNDTYGHDAGDVVLKRLARCLQETVRSDDTLCRLGGDEFLVVCSRTSARGAMQLAEVLRQEVSGLRVPVGADTWQGSISAGVATREPGMATHDDLLKAADQGLYVAKRNGRNGVALGTATPE